MMAAQSFKSMAGAITVAEVITMDGVEAIIMDGAIVTGAIIMAITVGETSLPSCGDYSGKKPPLGGFFFGRNSRVTSSSLLARADSVTEWPLMARTGPPAISAVRSLTGVNRMWRGQPNLVANGADIRHRRCIRPRAISSYVVTTTAAVKLLAVCAARSPARPVSAAARRTDE
jgi:hypothetical protein